MLDELGPSAYAASLEFHQSALRRALQSHEGVEVDTQGDSFFVAFSRAADAVGAAHESQAVLASTASACESESTPGSRC